MVTAYHGTGAYEEITKFKKSRSGSLGSGLIYFTSRKSTAEFYAVKDFGYGEIYEVLLDVDKPFVIPDNVAPVDAVLTPAGAEKRRACNDNYCFWLKASDYDNVRKRGFDHILYKDEIAVFDPQVIKIKGKTHVEMR